MWHASKQVASAQRVSSYSLPSSASGYRWLLVWFALLLLSSIQTIPLFASSQAQTEHATVYVLTFDGPVTPVLASYLNQAVREAESTNAAAIILQLDTPGGSIDVTQQIIQSMLASPIPLVVYVAPAGARAGSAGTFVTLAAHVAAMAPSTSIGAASPVDSGGGEIDPTLAAKITNILSADIENLASRRGEAATEWAIAAVQDAAAATASEALDLGVIDIIATDLNDLLEQLDGRTVELPSGQTTLQLTNAIIIEQAMTPVQRALNLLVDPNLVAILFSLGVIALIAEIRTPGLNVAGFVGVVSLVLAFYGMGQLDANLTGLAFMIIALALFVGEAFTPTFGVLTAGGIAAFLLGGALLFDTPGISTPWPTLNILAIMLGGLTLLVSYIALRAQRRPAYTGTEGLIGAIGSTKGAMRVGETGSVYVAGEWWNARLATPATQSEVAANSEVRVVARERMTLLVAPLHTETVAPVATSAKSATQLTQTEGS